MKYDPLSRRMFLQGLGGLTFGIPFLPSLLPKAYGQVAVPVKFVGVAGWHGQWSEAYYAGFKDSANQRIQDHVFVRQLNQISGPLGRVLGTQFDPIRSKISIFKGFDAIGNTKTHNTSMPFNAAMTDDESDSEGNKTTFGWSIDTVLEDSKKIYPTPPKLGCLRVAPGPAATTQSWSWRNNVRLPSVNSLNTAFNSVFGSGFAAPPGTNDPSIATRKKALDLVYQNYSSIMNGRQIGAEDKRLLQNYADMISDIQDKLQPPVQAAQCREPSRLAENSVTNIYNNYFDLICAALLCGATRLAMVYLRHFENVLVYDNSKFHTHCHVADSNEALGTPTRAYQAGLAASLMKKMDAITEANGATLLDNSIVVWTNNSGYTNNNAHGDIAVTIGGSGGGRLQAGYYIDYRQRPFTAPRPGWIGHSYGRAYNQLLMTVMEAMGLARADYQKNGNPGFGDPRMFEGVYYQSRALLPELRRPETLPFYLKA